VHQPDAEVVARPRLPLTEEALEERVVVDAVAEDAVSAEVEGESEQRDAAEDDMPPARAGLIPPCLEGRSDVRALGCNAAHCSRNRADARLVRAMTAGRPLR